MISDEYTREYDERQKQIELFNNLSRIANVAKRFGCEANIIYRLKDFTININLPDGSRLKQFRKLTTAMAWAEAWE